MPVWLFNFGGPSPFGLRFGVTARPPVLVGELLQVVVVALVPPEKMKGAITISDNRFGIVEQMNDNCGMVTLITPCTIICEDITDVLEIFTLEPMIGIMIMYISGQETQKISFHSVVILPCERPCHAVE